LRPDHDYVLIDSPAGIERGFRNAVAPADKVVIISNPEVSSVRDADRIIGLLEAEEKKPPSLVINRLKPNMVAQGDMLGINDVIDVLMIELIGVIPEDEQVLVAANRGTPVVLGNNSLAGQAFSNIAHRIEGEDVPFMSFDQQRGLRGFIKKLMGS
jgi:septum site-determining protein MinD